MLSAKEEGSCSVIFNVMCTNYTNLFPWILFYINVCEPEASIDTWQIATVSTAHNNFVFNCLL